MRRLVYYVFDQRLMEISKNISNLKHRALVVNSLIASYNLFSKCEIIEGELATDDDILLFHSEDYLNYLKKVQESSNKDALSFMEKADNFNLCYDCPLFEKIYDFVKVIAGSSLSAAKKLVYSFMHNSDIMHNSRVCNVFTKQKPRSYLKFKNKRKTDHKDGIFELPVSLTENEGACYNMEIPKDEYDFIETDCDAGLGNQSSSVECNDEASDSQIVAVNWFGGWHHAQKDGAEGFCYVNDIVIAILFLLKTFSRILYIDLDIHHGNAVESAFLFSPRVFVLNLHKYEAGFYPATGALCDIGEGKGKFYTSNVPLKDGITDDMYRKVFTEIVEKVFAKYKPKCIVVQCGADCITGDPLGGFNLTPVGLGYCLQLILDKKLPTLILGGGGYNIPGVAKCWTYLTSLVLGHSLSNDIPENPYFHLFGPSFEISVTPSLRRNENTEEYLKSIVDRVLKNLDCLPDI